MRVDGSPDSAAGLVAAGVFLSSRGYAAREGGGSPGAESREEADGGPKTDGHSFGHTLIIHQTSLCSIIFSLLTMSFIKF